MYLQSVLEALRDREAQYDTTLEQDHSILAQTRGEGRLGMAVLVRRGEKQLLRDAQSWTTMKLDKLRAAVTEQEGPATKRQRRA